MISRLCTAKKISSASGRSVLFSLTQKIEYQYDVNYFVVHRDHVRKYSTIKFQQNALLKSYLLKIQRVSAAAIIRDQTMMAVRWSMSDLS